MGRNLYIFIALSLILFLVTDTKYTQFGEEHQSKLATDLLPNDYIYLPAILTYHDIRKIEWIDTLSKKYDFKNLNALYYHDKSNLKLIRNSPGMAVLYLPAFYFAEFYCHITSQPKDGYALPYQISLHYWKIILLLIGLTLSYLHLAQYFSPTITFFSLMITVLTTQLTDIATSGEFFPYGQFFLTASFLYFLDKYWNKPTVLSSLMIGLSLGILVLSDLNYLVFILLIILWYISPQVSHIKAKIFHFLRHFKYYIPIFLISGAFLSVHLYYTKYLLDTYEFYNYDGRIFGFFWPNFLDAWFSVGFGWLVYTPSMIISLLGFITLYFQNKRLFYPFVITFLVFQGLLGSSNVNSFGTEIGNSYMVGIYPMLIFCSASFYQFFIEKKTFWFFPIGLALVICGYYNYWLIYHKQSGNFIASKEMSRDYFYHVLGREDLSPQTIKLLDTEIIYEGPIQDSIVIIKDRLRYCLDKKTQYTRRWEAIRQDTTHNQVRFILEALTSSTDVEVWHFAQMLISFYDQDANIKNEMIRVQRFTNNNEWTTVWIDAVLPKNTTKVVGSVWNAENDEKICFKNIKIYTYKVEKGNARI